MFRALKDCFACFQLVPVPKDAALKLYMSVCPSAGLSVCPSALVSVRRSHRHSLALAERPLTYTSVVPAGLLRLLRAILGPCLNPAGLSRLVRAIAEPLLDPTCLIPLLTGHMCGLSLGTGRDECSQPPAPIAIDVEVGPCKAMSTLFCLCMPIKSFHVCVGSKLNTSHLCL